MDRKIRGPRAGLTDDGSEDYILWKKILVDFQRLADIRERAESTLPEQEGRIHAKSAKQCEDFMEKAHEEKHIIQRALDNLSILVALRDGDSANGDSAAESKRKKRKIEAEGLNSNSKKIRRYSSADSNGIIPVNHQVAARTPKQKDKLEEWILARVLQFSAEKNKYVVEDDEADESGQKMQYVLPARSVIMIVDDQDSVPEFPIGHTVLALYPSTTCFYKAIVVQPPSKAKDGVAPVYKIKFDDDEGIERTAPPRMVLDMPKLK